MDGFYVGDIIGNSYTHENEKYNLKTKNFELFTNRSKFSDDTILTFATIDWLLNSDHTGKEMLNMIAQYYKKYPGKEPTIYGPYFASWANDGCKTFAPSYGNGGAMRSSPIAWFANSKNELNNLIKKGISPTHNTRKGKLGAKIVCYSIFYLRQGFGKNELKNKIEKDFKINLSQDINEYRNQYSYTSDAIETVRPAIISFLNSNDYEDAIRNAVSFGGDTDTITTICSAISEAFYKEIPKEILSKAKTFLPEEFVLLLETFLGRLKGQAKNIKN
ncbi:MAG: ADP-ribosylglycohydrolase family protein [Clostridia bacterium]